MVSDIRCHVGDSTGSLLFSAPDRARNELERYELIAAEQANYPIRWLCQLLKIRRREFYRWLSVKPSQRQLQERILAQQVSDIVEQSFVA